MSLFRILYLSIFKTYLIYFFDSHIKFCRFKCCWHTIVKLIFSLICRALLLWLLSYLFLCIPYSHTLIPPAFYIYYFLTIHMLATHSSCWGSQAILFYIPTNQPPPLQLNLKRIPTHICKCVVRMYAQTVPPKILRHSPYAPRPSYIHPRRP